MMRAMKSLQEHQQDLTDRGLWKFSADIDSPESAKAAKAQVVLQQKQLRLAKKEVGLSMQAIRADFAHRAQTAGSTGSTVLQVFGKRGKAGSWRAAAKADLRLERDRVLAGYQDLKHAIDAALIELDAAKIQIAEYLNNSK